MLFTQGGHGTGNLVINFSRQKKHREFKEFNRNTWKTRNLDKAGKMDNF